MREQIRRREVRRRADGGERHDASDDQQEGRDPVRDAAEDLEPPAGSEAEQIQAKAERQASQDEDRREGSAVSERRCRRAEHDEHVGGDEEQQRGEVEQVVHPHAPAADEPVHRAERPAGPRIEAALIRIPARELVHRAGERQKEEAPREHPEHHRRRADARAATDPAEPHDGGHVHRDEITEPEHLAELRRISHVVGAES